MTAAQLHALIKGGSPQKREQKSQGDIASLVALSRMPLVG